MKKHKEGLFAFPGGGSEPYIKLRVKGKVTFFARFKSNRLQFLMQICPLKSYSKRKQLFSGCEDDVFRAFAVIALGFGRDLTSGLARGR